MTHFGSFSCRLILIVALALGVLMTGRGQCSVTGLCADCHVMHASQAGASLTPRDSLLRQTCLGCHTGENGGAGWKTPFVLTSETGTSLAGGNFFFSGLNIHYGHNPIELGVSSIVTPPGWVYNVFTANGKVGDAVTWTSQLSCDGVWGCHGTHAPNGMFGSHHNNPTGQVITANKIGNSYRFLYQIKGFEDSDWEYTKTSVDHNVYSGDIRLSDTAGGSSTTISYFCAECHGIFHSNSGGDPNNEGVSGASFASPWIRHPVDISMPSSGEYLSYNGTNTYSTDIPLASQSPPVASSNSVTAAGDRIVMCLSCHKAHATPYYAMLRWDYRASAGGTNGCGTCHTSKS